MAFEDATPEPEREDTPRLTEVERIGPLIPPAAQEPVIVLVLGLLLFTCLVILSWMRMDARAPRSSQRSMQSVRSETYINQLMLKLRLSKTLFTDPVFSGSLRNNFTKTAVGWEQLAQAQSPADEQAQMLLNAAALYGAGEQFAPARNDLVRAASQNPQLKTVVAELQSLYQPTPHAVRFSAQTQATLDTLATGPLFRARNAMISGNTSSAITALQPGAAAGIRACIFFLCIFLFFCGIVGGVIITCLVQYRNIGHAFKAVLVKQDTELPWGPGTALILISTVFFLSMLVGTLIGQSLGKPGGSGGMMAIAISSGAEILCFVLVMGVFLLALERKPTDWRIFGWDRSMRGLGFAALAFLLSLPLVWLAGYLSFLLLGGRETIHPLIPLLQKTHNAWWQLVLVLTAVGMAPVVEETLFRGLLFRALGARLPFWSAAGISGILFAVLHGQAFAVLPITVLGVMLAFIFKRTNNLFASAMAHAMQNGMAVIFTLISVWALHGPGRL